MGAESSVGDVPGPVGRPSRGRAPVTEVLLRALAATIPFYVVGFKVTTYEMGLPVLVLLLLDLGLVLRGRFNRATLMLLFVWVTWCMVTAVWRHPLSSYVFSLGALVAVVLPLTVDWKGLDQRRLFMSFLLGLGVSFCFAAYDVGVAVLGLTPLEELVGVGIITQSRTAEILVFRRVKALMMEPADYAIYLAFAYAIVDRFGPRFIGGVARGILKGLILVFLATTVSLSGVLLLLAYFGTRSLVAVGRGRWSRPAFARSLVVVPPLILGFALFLRSDAAEPGLVFLQRASRAVEVVQSGVLTGSEGSRANALPVLGAYWSGGGVSRVIWGEGYANHEAWLVREYGDLGEFSSFAQGQINNVMAVLGIATGAVGLVMYLLFCGRIAFQRDRGLPVAVLAIWLVANMASGMLVGYLLWSLVLVVRVLEAAPYPYPSRGGAAA